MILNNPSNPTGSMYNRWELEAIAKVCVEKDIYVISDEIYYSLVYDNAEFVSFASLGDDVKERTLLINGVSKSYAMTGWRIGYVAANHEIAKIISNYLSHCIGSPCAVSQKAALEALTASQESVDELSGRATAIQGHTYSIAENTRLLLSSVNMILSSVLNIERHTETMADEATEMRKQVKEVKESVNDIVTKGIKLR